MDFFIIKEQIRTFLTILKKTDSMQISWGYSSAGRALRSQCRGRGFNPP